MIKTKSDEAIPQTREEYVNHKAELEQAWKELDDERDKINKLDIEIAKLKDDKAKTDKINENLIQSFQDLYNQYIQLYDQVTNSNAAIVITSGKLAEALVKFKFIIPQSTNQQT